MDVLLKAYGIALLGGLLSGCVKSACEDEAPSFLLEVTGDFSTLTALRVELSGTLGNLRRDFALGEVGADGSTSLVVELAPPPESPIELTITVIGLDAQQAPRGSAQRSTTLVANGCNRIRLQLGEGADAGVDRADTGAQDSGPEDLGIGDADPGDNGLNDLGTADLGPPDLGVDGGEMPDIGIDTGIDGGVDAGGCVQMLDPTTVALYTLDGDATDLSGAHPGNLNGNTDFEPGPAGCGQALGLSNAGVVQGHLSIPHAQPFALASGAIDLWVYPNINGRAMGVLTKDAQGASDAFGLFVACSGHLVANLRVGDSNYYQCSTQPLPSNSWSHIGLNFGAGGFALYIDGGQAQGAQSQGLFGGNCNETITCGTSTTAGLQNSTQPWILGASSHDSPNGSGNLSLPLRAGRVDNLRLSSAPRIFQ